MSGPMASSPARDRWQALWSVYRPMTKLSVAFPADTLRDLESLRDRLPDLARRHGIPFDLTEAAILPAEAPDTAPRCRILLDQTAGLLTLEAPSIVLDAASAVTLAGQLLEGGDPTAMDYADVARWWRETLAARREDGVVHWDAADAGSGTIRPPWGIASRPSEMRPRFVELAPQPHDQARIRRCADTLGISVADLMCATWIVFLSRWTDGQDVLLADIHDGRTLDELHPVIGPLERALPLSCSYDPTLPFDRFARRVKAERDAAAEWQDYYLQPAGQSYIPFGFACREPQPRWEEGSARIVALSSVLEPFTLLLDLRILPDSWLLSLGGDAELIEDPELAAAGEAFLHLLDGFLRDSSASLATPPLTDRSEASPPAVLSLDRPLQDRLADAMRHYADRIALADDQRRLSYRDLERAVDRLSGDLLAQGVFRGEKIALRMPSSAAAIIALLAVLRAGAAYVPMDMSAPDDRVDYMMKDCGIRFMLRPDPTGENGIAVGVMAGASTRPVDDGEAAEDLAYVIYTSGSTGRPKGVAVARQAIVSLANALGPILYDHLPTPIAVAQMASLAFDASVQQIFGALLHGQTLCPVDAETKRDPALLCAFLRRYGIGVADGTPSLFDMLVRYRPEELGQLPTRHWIIGGEPLPVDLVRRFYQCPGTSETRLTNVYGLTECGVDSSAITLDATWPAARQRDVPIGTALDGAEILLLDPLGRPLPSGAVGELYIGGPRLAAKYLNDPALTAARFLPHPNRQDERVFRTGDRGWRGADGLFHFAERRDEQVKLRGHRLDLGEVRHAILSCPGIEQAAVLLYSPQDEPEQLAAFIAGTELPAAAALRAHLRVRLAEVMIPQHILPVETLPLTMSGKLDRAALLTTLADRTRQAATLGGTPEEVVTRIFRQALGDEMLSAEDDFFAAGGNSLLALKAVMQISRALAREVELRSLYANPTAASLCRALLDRTPHHTRLTGLRPPRSGGLDILFLPPVLGSSRIFADLALRLPDRYTPWSVDYRVEGRPLERSVEELAAALFGEMQDRLHSPAILLVGYSLGAAVAFELALLAEAQGHAPKLVLIDSMPGSPSAGAPRGLPETIAEDPLLVERVRALRALAEGYEPSGEVACDIVALEARDNPVRLGMTGWRRRTSGRFRHILVPGTHDTLLASPHLDVFSDELLGGLEFLVNPDTETGQPHLTGARAHADL